MAQFYPLLCKVFFSDSFGWNHKVKVAKVKLLGVCMGDNLNILSLKSELCSKASQKVECIRHPSCHFNLLSPSMELIRWQKDLLNCAKLPTLYIWSTTLLYYIKKMTLHQDVNARFSRPRTLTTTSETAIFRYLILILLQVTALTKMQPLLWSKLTVKLNT